MPRKYLAILTEIFILFGLYVTSLYSYLFFHSIVEIFCVLIAFCIFVITWNSKQFIDNTYLVFIGIAFLFIGAIDIFHLLAYKGMGVFRGYDANLSTQFWIAGRYVQSLSLFLAPLMLGRKLKINIVLLGYTAITLLLLGSIFYWDIFPNCFIEGTGLTLFKKLSEYIICLILLASLFLLYRKRQEFNQEVLRRLVFSILLTIASELAFTLYVDVYGFSNLIGHFLRLMAFYLVYRALIETALKKPYSLLFRSLAQSEKELRKTKEELEIKVAERTGELRNANQQLQRELTERQRAEEALRQSEEKYRTVANYNYDWEYWISPDKKLSYVSPSCLRITGYDAEEFMANPGLIVEIAHPADQAMIVNHIQLFSHHDWGIQEMEYRILTREGEERWLSHYCLPVYNDAGDYLGRRASNRDVTARKLAEAALEKRLIALSKPLDDPEGIYFHDLFNIEDIQRLQDLFAKATGVASIITNPDGTPITKPSNFCRLCIEIIRQTEVGLKNCYYSDAIIGRHHPEGPVIQPCLSGGLWDAGASITVGGRHIANWLIGQVRNEAQSEEKMREYARQIGVNEEEFIKAFYEVNTMPESQFKQVADALFALANQLSAVAYQNVQQARFITERQQAEEALRQSEWRKGILSRISVVFLTIPDEEMYAEVLDIVLEVTESKFGVFGFIADNGDLVIPSMTREIWGECQVPDKSIVFPADTWGHSLWGKAIRERQAFCSDGPFQTPEGHIQIDNFLTAPIVFGKKTIGLLSVANRATGYTDEDKELLEGITNFVSPMVNAQMERDRQEQERLRAEEALRKSAAEIHDLYNRAPCGYHSLNADGVFVQINETELQWLGFTKDEIVGKKRFTDVISERSLKTFHDNFPLFKVQGWMRDLEFEMVRKDGTILPVLLSATLVTDPDGNYVMTRSTLYDLTARKRVENIMQARLRLLEFANTHSLDELLTATLDEIEALTGSAISFYHFLEADQQTLSLQNWSTNTLKNMCTAAGKGSHYAVAQAGVWVDCIHERRPVIHNDYASLPHRKGMPEGHAPVGRELVVPIFRGTLIKAIIGVGNKASNYNGNDIEIVSQVGDLSWDIVEHKRAEEALRQSEQKFRLLYDNAPLGYQSLDEDGLIIEINQTWLDILGYAREEVIGRWIGDFLTPDYVEYFTKNFPCFKETGEINDIQFELVQRDGTIITTSFSGKIAHDAQGRFLRTHCMFQDITARKRAEEEIRRLNLELEQRVIDRTAQLEAANQELEAFAYSVSHDLRAPLRHIDGFLELLEKRTATTLDDKSQHYMTTIFDSTRRMGLLIDDLLSFSRMGRCEMLKKLVDLNGLIQEVIQELEPEVQGRAIRWQVADFPMVSGDAAMLRIVLINLISNALKFTRPRPQAEIGLGCLPGRETETIIFIRDNGVGFDMHYADKLFGVFQRLHHQDEFEGTGIGLANVRRIINRHGGRTWAEGKVNQGATFYFSLPKPLQGA
jgi:PAS domain S-box-containing protein